jgi:purine-binding chemotaxis protein CheW
MSITQTTQGNCLAQAGKYLTFALGKEDYGLEILKVREIIGVMNITAVPQVPGYVKGIINLRGKVIPVIDLRLKFAMSEIKETAETCIIVINLNDVLIGIIIDKVKEVLDIKQENIEPAPNFGSNVHTDYILGIGKINATVKILLNIEKVLGEDLTIADKVS